MDPLSVPASIAGLLTASLEIGKLFAAIITAYDYARTVHDEIHHFRFVLFRLDKYIHSDSMNVARASMIDLDQVVTVLVGCVCTFSELERELKRLLSWPEGLRRMRWAMAKPGLVDLVQRLQNHKGTICSMLLILTCESQDEALGGMHELQREVADLVRINGKMMAKLELGSVTAGYASSSGASIAGSVRTTRSVLSFSSARTNFASTLNNSRVYRRALLGRVNKPGPATGQSSALSIQQPWSVLSAVSLSEVSNYAVYSLPISAQELYNPTWYTTPSLIVPLEPSMGAAAPTFLATAFVEALKIALKQNDVETANTLANYIPWNIALEMSAVYKRPTADTPLSDGRVPGSLALFELWLRCGGEAEAKDQHGETAIIKAVKDRDWALFKLIVHNGPDISSTWNSNKTGFHLSSEGGDENLLLGVSKDIEANEGAEVTPVCPGLKPKCGWAVKDLLGLGESINDQDQWGVTALSSASGGGHWEVVEILLSQEADIEARNSMGKTALHSAAAGGHKDVFEILLSHGAAIEANDIQIMTALHSAAAGGHKDVVEILLSHGAAIEANDIQVMTALHSAAAGGHKDVVEILLSHGASIEAKSSGGMTALHSAAESGHKDVVEILLSHGAAIEANSNQLRTALHFAAAGGHKDVAEILLSHGAAIEAKGCGGVTALHLAAAGGHKDVVEILLSHGVAIEAKSNQLRTALHSAAAGGHKDVVEILLSHGAAIEANDIRVMTALHSAAAGGHKDVVEILLSHGAAIEAKGSDGVTALHLAAAGGHKDVVEILLSHGAAIEAKSNQLRTALHFAAAGGHKDVVEILLSHGAAIEANDIQVMTALHSAAAGGHKDVVEILLSHGASIEAKSSGGMTALHSAAERGHIDVVALLFKHDPDSKTKKSRAEDADEEASAGGHTGVVPTLHNVAQE